MTKKDTEAFRLKLLTIRARLMGDVNGLAAAALHEADGSTMPIHMAERGSEAHEQEFALSLMATDEDTCAQIDEALQRLRDGVYGICIECGKPIPKARLNALPYVAKCVACAERHES